MTWRCRFGFHVWERSVRRTRMPDCDYRIAVERNECSRCRKWSKVFDAWIERAR